jgi:PBSX family phage portal protein
MIDDLQVEIQFGEPISVLDGPMIDYIGTFLEPSGMYYLPPISLNGLSKMRGANSYHGSALIFRRNMIVNAVVENKYMSLSDFRNANTDLITFGNCYLKIVKNRMGILKRIEHVPGLNMRAKRDGTYIMLQPYFQNIEFRKGEIIHVMDYDTQQNIYGIPDWLGGLQSALLNMDATLFRRKYFKNGCHIGNIFYSNDPKLAPDTVDAIKKAVKEGKGIGNFKSMFVHSPNGHEKGFQVIPVGDISQKDEFYHIKNISSDDILASHRVNAALLAIPPKNQAGYGNLQDIHDVYIQTEVTAFAKLWTQINKQLPDKAQIAFDFDKIKIKEKAA